MKCPVCDKVKCVCAKTSDVALPMKSTLSPDVTPFPDSTKKNRMKSVNKPPAMLLRYDNIPDHTGVPKAKSFDSRRERTSQEFSNMKRNNVGVGSYSSSHMYSQRLPSRPVNFRTFNKPFIPFEEYVSRAQHVYSECEICSKAGYKINQHQQVSKALKCFKIDICSVNICSVFI